MKPALEFSGERTDSVSEIGSPIRHTTVGCQEMFGFGACQKMMTTFQSLRGLTTSLQWSTTLGSSTDHFRKY